MDMSPTARFSDRAEIYARYRPDYPAGAVAVLELGPSMKVADIGCGTGILTRHLLQAGCEVFAVEPNGPMRTLAEQALSKIPGYHSLNATAEATGLPASSVDLVTAAQAFHWFRPDETREEFRRILTPRGRVALIWNDRRTGTSPLLREYEQLLLDFAIDYEEVGHRGGEAEQVELFLVNYSEHRFDNHQALDWDGLRGRLLSCSYVPREGHPDYQPMLDGLRRIFDAHQRNGKVVMEYDTRVYLGRV